MVVLPAAGSRRCVSASSQQQPPKTSVNIHEPNHSPKRSSHMQTDAHPLIVRCRLTIVALDVCLLPPSAYQQSTAAYTTREAHRSANQQHKRVSSLLDEHIIESHPDHSAYRPVPPSGSASPSCQTSWRTPWTGTSPWWATAPGRARARARTTGSGRERGA